MLTIDNVATLIAGLPASYRMAFGGLSSLYSEYGVGVGTMGVVLPPLLYGVPKLIS
jgi:hypothetical protein